MKFKITWLWWLVLIIMVLGVGGYLFSRHGGESAQYYTVASVNLAQEVRVTGKVKPAAKADLAFAHTGRITLSAVKVGDPVAAGTLLAELDSADLTASRAKALADLAALRRGARPEDLAVSVAQVASAQTALDNVRSDLATAINDARVKADDVFHKNVSEAFANPRSKYSDLAFSSSHVDLEVKLPGRRADLEDALALWNDDYNQAHDFLIKLRNFVNDLALVVNDLALNVTVNGLSASTLKSDISSGRTNLNNAINSLENAQTTWQTAEHNLTVAQKELALKQAGSSVEEVTAQEAVVAQAEAMLRDQMLLAPFAGEVTYQEARVGETAPAGTTLITVVATDPFIIEANVPEVEIAKVKAGDETKITLDAYGPTVSFDAAVSLIDPAETMVEGVPNYKVTLTFKNLDERIKSGMTANLIIKTGDQQNALAVPIRAITYSDQNEPQVLLHNQNKNQNVATKIKIGLTSSNGQVEILSGLNLGDEIVLP